MSVIRSLELVSDSRDRNLYPNPADFTVNVNEMTTILVLLKVFMTFNKIKEKILRQFEIFWI